ncbi:phosphatase PAP2 family protein [Fulvivirgaceae bacterium BMA10]|uniref:Phosphatase PAP2 family protein n=1 Tax=Splendidivirga corallicola TaxID=3051826 RepID=A0ABT8KZD6_9BACT|nr:phosphatase PAP2 family protein [Fulvivirgaceae bacterium BMA10]
MNLKQTNTFLLFFSTFLILGSFLVIFIPKGEIILLVNAHHHSFLDTFFKYVTFLGDGTWFAIIFLVFLFIRYTYALIGLLMTTIQTVIVHFCKQIWFHNAPRPSAFFNGQIDLYFVEGVDVHSWGSFPSGHTATAFAIALFFTIIFHKNKLLSLPLFIAAVLVGFSRVYLSQHFFIDIYFGAFVGVISTITAFAIFELLNKESKTYKSLNRSLMTRSKFRSLKS